MSSLWQVFLVYGGVYGLGSAGASIATVGMMISRWFPGRTGIAASVAISGNALGQLFLIAMLASFVLLGAGILLIVLPLVLVSVRSRPLRPNTVEPGWNGSPGVTRPGVEARGTNGDDMTKGPLLASSQLWLLLAVYAVCGFQDFFVVTHIVAFADDQGIGPVLAGNMLALMGLMGLAGVLASGLMADSLGARWPAALCFTTRIAIFAVIMVSRSPAGVVAFALLYGSTFLVTAPLTVIFARNLFGPSRLGTVSGLISMVHQIAGGLGAYIGALIFDATGSYYRAFALMLVLAFMATAGALRVRERPSYRPASSG